METESGDGLEEWTKTGREVRSLDPVAFRRLLIAAKSIAELHTAADPAMVATYAISMMDSTDGLLS